MNQAARVTSQRGFSLVELMVVLVLVGIVLRFVVPGFSHYRLTLVQSRTKGMVIEDLRAARQRAITRHMPVIIAFGNGFTTTNLTTYTVHADANADYTYQATELKMSKTVPRDSKLSKISMTPTDTLIFDVSGSLRTGTNGGRITIKTGTLIDTLAVSIAGIVYEP